jgi:signal transduction histidine kinase
VLCDTGPGIAEAERGKIFKEFQQADSSIDPPPIGAVQEER